MSVRAWSHKNTEDYGRFSATALCVPGNVFKALWFLQCSLVRFLPIVSTGENPPEHREQLQKSLCNLEYFYATGPRRLGEEGVGGAQEAGEETGCRFLGKLEAQQTSTQEKLN